MPAKTSKKHPHRDPDPLKPFDGRITRWFRERYGSASEVQKMAWPVIARGDHLLLTAPTGSGKTLAAFLWALNQLLSGAWSGGRPRVLYVSPLKALNTDVRRNLLIPLRALLPLFADPTGHSPPVRVLTRSGDTPQSERRRMLRQPPEILITTPESLNLLLNSRGGQSLLQDLKTVILDEIHAVAGGKRGVHLITAVERLALISGEFQRVALSATVRPLDAIAHFVGGYALEGSPSAPLYRRRPVKIVQTGEQKRYDVRVHYPAVPQNDGNRDSVWEPLADALLAKIRQNRSTLVFTPSRKLSEKMAYLVNTAAETLLAYAHHGSLAPNIRQQVETRLKRGELKAVFATSSLELGIDIGALEEVVQLQTPPSIASAVQRAGRAGHRVGAASRTSIFCTHPADLVPAAVLGRAIVTQDIDPLLPILAPLDVLAQVVVGMVALEPTNRRELYLRIRCAAPYHHLSERQFDLVLNMLTGRYASTRLRELKARVAIDPQTGLVQARRGALQALYLSGGTIPDRGYFTLRHHHEGSRIGELDEEFVWEARIGQVFTLGTQNWRIQKITASDVFVVPAPGSRMAPPFWRADSGGRNAHFATRIAEFLEWIDGRLQDSALSQVLQQEYALDQPAAEGLIRWLRQQQQHTGCPLPHRHHLVMEHIHSGPGGAPGHQLALHLPWGGQLNWPLALALEAALEAELGQAPEIFAQDDLILIINPPALDLDQFLSLVDARRLLPLLQRRLEGSGYFGARFRTAAGRALLLTRGSLKRRMPLWMTRLKSQKLLAAVMPFEDFPLLLEAWRSCLNDGFDLEALETRLNEIADGVIRHSEITTASPSPMAQAAAWGQINTLMYRDDSAREAGRSHLQRDLLKEVVYAQQLQPQVAADLAAEFEAKRQRTSPDYAPADVLELEAWVRDRLLLPLAEWQRLLGAVQRDHQIAPDALLPSVADRLGCLVPPGRHQTDAGLVVCRDMATDLHAALWPAASIQLRHLTSGLPLQAPPSTDAAPPPSESLLSQWISYYGPVTVSWVATTLMLQRHHLDAWVAALVHADRLIQGPLIAQSEDIQICDVENYEILLRMGRASRRVAIEALPTADLPLLMAHHQGLCGQECQTVDDADRPPGAPPPDVKGPTAVQQHLVTLAGWPAIAAQWESELLPARIPDYQSTWLDAVLQAEELIWWGCGPQRLTFCYADELDLITLPKGTDDAAGELDHDSAGSPGGAETPGARYPFDSLPGEGPWDRRYRDIWESVWAGDLVNDGYHAVRQGLANRFKWPAAMPAAARPTRGRRRRGRGARPRHLKVPGNWYRPAIAPPPPDELAALETEKERVRLLLHRYGILFRSLVANELPAFAWHRLFHALRLMELAGEVVGGHFIEGAPGPQFISPELGQTLARGLNREAIFCLNAADPASCCGLGLTGMDLPARRPTTHLVYHGSRLVVVSARRGRSLSIQPDVDEKYLEQYLIVYDHLLKFKMNGSGAITIETINDAPAPLSPYLTALRRRFEVSVDPNSVTVYRPWISSA